MLVLMNSVVATPRSHGFRLLIKVVYSGSTFWNKFK